MHVVIGYFQLRPGEDAPAELIATMLAMGAHVVRVEEPVDNGGLLKPMLNAICDFIGDGDELIAPGVSHLGESREAVLEVIRRLRRRGAHVRLLEPEVSTAEAGAQAFLEALAGLRSAEAWTAASRPGARRGRVDARAVMALRAHGFGPSQIAQKLGVSRMTVWRKLAANEEEPA